MSEHKVEITTKNAPLGKGNTGITLVIYNGNDESIGKLGTLMISRGAIYWTPPRKNKSKKIRKTWTELKDFFEQQQA